MLFEQSLPVPASVDRVWADVTDLAALADCLPGARLESIDSEGRSHGAMTVRVGSIVTSFGGAAWVASRDDAAKTVEVVAEGQGAQGRARAQIKAQVRPDGVGSVLDLAVSVDISGPLARLGQGMAQPVVGQLMERFAAALSARLSGEAPSAPAPAAAVDGPAAVDQGSDALDLGALLALPPSLRRGALAALASVLLLVVVRLLSRPAQPATVVIFACADPAHSATSS